MNIASTVAHGMYNAVGYVASSYILAGLPYGAAGYAGAHLAFAEENALESTQAGLVSVVHTFATIRLANNMFSLVGAPVTVSLKFLAVPISLAALRAAAQYFGSDFADRSLEDLQKNFAQFGTGISLLSAASTVILGQMTFAIGCVGGIICVALYFDDSDD